MLLDHPAKITLMNEGLTRELPNGRSFEERVFARFDAMDARFEAMKVRFEAMEVRWEKRFTVIDQRLATIDTRLNGLESRVQALEARALDTKPIWERALAEILQIRNGVENLNRKMDVLTLDMMQLRADQRRVEKRMDDLETRFQ